jgi:hypothetical protein
MIAVVMKPAERSHRASLTKLCLVLLLVAVPAPILQGSCDGHLDFGGSVSGQGGAAGATGSAGTAGTAGAGGFAGSSGGGGRDNTAGTAGAGGTRRCLTDEDCGSSDLRCDSGMCEPCEMDEDDNDC